MFILAGFRSRDDLACSYRRAGRNVPVEGNERRLYLHPCAIGRLDNSLAVIAAKFRRLNVTASELLLLPIYYLLVSAATWVAMLDLALRPHYWAKTAHGRSRQRQTPVTRRTQLST